MVFADVGDTVSAEPAPNWRLSVDGPYAGELAPADPDNLVLQAARALADATNAPNRAALHLDKNLPVASGLGGGSADAAATLRLMRQFLPVDLPDERLLALAEGLGADVPMCLAGVPLIARGKGERLQPVAAMPTLHLVLVHPGVMVSTPAVFGAYAPPYDPPLPPTPDGFASAAELVGWLERTRNGLEHAATTIVPEIGEAIAALRATPACRLARMSGSGATCFGIFPDDETAEAAAARLAAGWPGWWVRATRTGAA